MVNSRLFVQFLWPLPAIIKIFTKDLHFISLHDMFRRLAPCSRGGFYKNDNFPTFNRPSISAPMKSESGDKDLQKSQCLKNLDPSGVFPPWGSPAVSLPLLSCWLVVPTAGSASVAPMTRLHDGVDLPQLVVEQLVVDWHLWQDCMMVSTSPS